MASRLSRQHKRRKFITLRLIWRILSGGTWLDLRQSINEGRPTPPAASRTIAAAADPGVGRSIIPGHSRATAMNKADLVAQVADTAGVSKGTAVATLDTVLADIKLALKKGEDVSLYGFGTFSVASRAARKGRNPKTGPEVDIPASRSPKFSASKTLKHEVNRS